MNIATYSARNVFRRPGRAIATLAVIAFVVLCFCLIRTMIVAWNVGAEAASSDRLVIVHKVGFTIPLPRHYIEELRQIPEVKAATWANWFASKDPKKRVPFFAGFAVDAETWFDVNDEMSVPPDQLATWKRTRNGAILGDKLAEALQVKVGDKVVINSDIYEGDWEFQVIGLYKPTRKTADRTTFLFHWNYLNDDKRAERSRDKIGWMQARIADSRRSAEIARAIDSKFDVRDDQTAAMSERQFQLSFLAMFSAMLDVLAFGSLVILLIMALVVGNTLAMNVRERAHEYGVLRAIGFSPGHVLGFILAESIFISLLGGLIGIGLAYLAINMGIGPVLEESGGFIPYFRTPGYLFGIALAAVVGLGAVAGVIPAYLGSRRKVTDALRRID